MIYLITSSSLFICPETIYSILVLYLWCQSNQILRKLEFIVKCYRNLFSLSEWVSIKQKNIEKRGKRGKRTLAIWNLIVILFVIFPLLNSLKGCTSHRTEKSISCLSCKLPWGQSLRFTMGINIFEFG